MPISNQNSNKSLDEDQFWLWQYKRRNATYRADYDLFKQKLAEYGLEYSDLSYVNKRVPDELYQKKLNFIKKHRQDPLNYDSGPDSKLLLTEIIKGEFRCFKYRPEGIFLKSKILDFSWPSLTISINLNENLKYILDEIGYLYYEYILTHELESPARLKKFTIEVDAPASNPSKKKRKILSNSQIIFEYHELAQKSRNSILKSQAGIRQGSRQHLPRAVGLWLWDRYTNTGKVRGAKKSIYDELSSIIITESNPAYRDNGYLDKLFYRTKKCIERVETLSMK